MKQVIFIGGSSYSGSTFLNLILANAPDAFSCGEVSMFFRPYKQKYLEPDCSCGDPQCTVWPQLREGGESKLYENIFRMFPHINVIVDSSKNPLWIRDMSEHLQDSGINYKNILIWKTPDEFRSSRIKRGRERGWRRAWVNYHRSYFRLVDDWLSIQYSDIAKNPSLLKPLCARLDLPYHEGQEEYWNKTHHSLYGNSSANIHLHRQNSNAYQYYEQEIKDSWRSFNLEGSLHQKINYAADSEAPSIEPNEPDSDELTRRIVDVLMAKDFQKTVDVRPDKEIQLQVEKLKAIKIWPMLQRARYFVRSLAVRL
ncbi:MAG: hypothetical protein ACU841_00770 [Gammaproteobacteria bacterium]